MGSFLLSPKLYSLEDWKPEENLRELNGGFVKVGAI